MRAASRLAEPVDHHEDHTRRVDTIGDQLGIIGNQCQRIASSITGVLSRRDEFVPEIAVDPEVSGLAVGQTEIDEGRRVWQVRKSAPIRIGDRHTLLSQEDLKTIQVGSDHGLLSGPPRFDYGVTAIGIRVPELRRIPRKG